jgi:hypothetical protein
VPLLRQAINSQCLARRALQLARLPFVTGNSQQYARSRRRNAPSPSGQRWRHHPAAAALGLQLEYGALALNPRVRLFGATSAWSLATDLQLKQVLAHAHRRLASTRWSLIDVRRVYTGTTA